MIPSRFGFALDGYSGSPELSNPTFLAQFLSDTCEAAGMRLIDLAIRNVEGSIPENERWHDEGGISAHALISTSHICLHTWPKDSFFMLDVVSCRPFDIEHVKAFVLLRLNVKAIKRFEVTADGDSDPLVQGGARAHARSACRAAPAAPG